ncbi:alpha/beta hydrolase [Leptospira koniambonensis]|uniref:Alpha/beta hydrolase n=1 Tax=Leptospira koniambonensis TaxID=2484950 RepID=A0A4R9JBR9_9LEPT|nr:alpha/beta hydrolase [Leptospira koniambonensis]TGL36820.1 alpha/beta hydrolase [Leptospira koniambonensis]
MKVLVTIVSLIVLTGLQLNAKSIDESQRAILLQNGDASEFISLPMGVMHVRISGPKDGPVVLLVHGAVIGGYAYKNWQKPLADAGFRVIVPDLFGYGLSDRPDIDYTKDFYVLQLKQLLEKLRIESPVQIVGASMGGAIVAAFTANYPEKVKSVVLMAPAGVGKDNRPTSSILLWPGLGDLIFHFFGSAQMKRQMDEANVNSPDRQNIAHWMELQTQYTGFAEGILNTLRHYKIYWQPEDFQALGKTKKAVLTLWGTSDTVNAFEQSQTLQEFVPQAKIIPIQDKGHAITFNVSERVLEFVIDFLLGNSLRK